MDASPHDYLMLAGGSPQGRQADYIRIGITGSLVGGERFSRSDTYQKIHITATLIPNVTFFSTLASLKVHQVLLGVEHKLVNVNW